MAVVYKAIQRNLDRVVAVKALPPQFTMDKEFLERFHREARSAAKVHHPNIITIYDEGVESGVHYISMEFLEGNDLHKLIRQNERLSVEEIVKVLAPIAEALGFAHKNGLIHRDVKSSNIFVTTERRPVLTDFGIARATAGTQLTRTGAIIGTPEFMSPEQASGMEIDGRSDLYSLGVVLYQSLTGRFPYAGDSPQTVIYKILNDTYIPARKLVNIPGWIDAIIERCLEKSIDRRFQTGAELSDMLRRKASAERITASTPPTVKAGTRRVLRIPAVVGSKFQPVPVGGRLIHKGMLYVVLIVMAFGTIGYFAWQRNSAGSDQSARQHVPATNSTMRDTQRHVSTQNIKVPNVVGMITEEATATLQKAGLKLGTVSKVYSSPGNKNRIVKQIPKESTEAEPQTAVNIFVGE
jgi:serine/threonine protein kinase